jgi:hypothetical protein
MNRFISRIGKAVVVLGVSGFVMPLSAWAAGIGVHSSAGSSSSYHAPSHPAQPSSSHAYTHSSSSGSSAATGSISSSSTLRTVHNTTNVSGGSTTPKISKVNGTSSPQTTIMSGSGTVGSTNVGGNLVFKRNVKNPTGASATLPAGAGHVLGTTTPASTNVMDFAGDVAYLWKLLSPLQLAPYAGQGGGPNLQSGKDGASNGNDPNHLGDGASDSQYGDGEAMPEPAKKPVKIWSGSTSLASSANVNAKGTAEKVSVALAKGKQVQNHLDQVATANSPAGKLQKGEQIQKQMGDAANNTGSNPNGPKAKLQKGAQIQKQISAGTSNPTTPVPNPPAPPAPGPSTTTTTSVPVVVPFPLSSAIGWGYFGGGFGGGAGIGSDDAGSGDASDAAAAAPPADPATPAASQAADGELMLKLGESYTIANENFGTTAGKLSLQLNGLALAVHVDQWDADQISFTLPVAGLTKATEAKFQIKGADQQLLKTVTVMVASADAAQ